jgi:hypothetical protein
MLIFFSDYLAFVEPHLLQSDEVCLPNFNCIHRSNCQRNRNSEGAIVFSRNGKEVSEIHVDNSGTGHCLFVKWSVSNLNLIMVYKSPKYSTSQFIEQLRTQLSVSENKMLVFGDFNINLKESEGKQLSALFQEFELTSTLNIHHPTTNGGSHIDCCFSNHEDVEAWIYESYYSYHKPICIVWPRQ